MLNQSRFEPMAVPAGKVSFTFGGNNPRMSATTDDRIKVSCTKCKNSFRERARNLRSGYQTQCPHCYRMITFDEGSDDLGVRRALTQARRVRTGFVPETPETSSRSG